MDISKLIARKEAEIEKLKDDIKQLQQAQRIVERAAGVTMKAKASVSRPRGRRGEKKAKVLSVLTDNPQRMRDIADAAKLPSSAVASALTNLVKSDEAVKGKETGTYLLKTAPKGRATAKKTVARKKPVAKAGS